MMMGWILPFGVSAAAVLFLTLITKGAFLNWCAVGLDWLVKKPHRIIIAVLLIIAAAGWWTAHGNGQRADGWQRASAAEASAHQETKARTQAAAISAKLLAEQNRAAVEAQWQAQYQDAVHAYEDLSRRNAGLVRDWLQQSGQSANPADPRGTSSADLPSLAEMPSGTLHDPATAILPITDLYLSAQAFAQLEALVGWIEAAQNVETSPAEPTT